MSLWGIALLALIAYHFPNFFMWWMILAAFGGLVILWEKITGQIL